MTYPARKKRPPRQKPDQVLTPDMRRQEARCYGACAPMDALAVEMDRKWGIDRLPELVPPEMAERYFGILADINEAVQDHDPEKTLELVNRAITGLHVMDATATKAGHVPVDPEIWEHDFDGYTFGIYRDGRDWRAVENARPDLKGRLFSLREIAVALHAMRVDHPILRQAKSISGAQIEAIGKKLPAKFKKDGGDEIPF